MEENRNEQDSQCRCYECGDTAEHLIGNLGYCTPCAMHACGIRVIKKAMACAECRKPLIGNILVTDSVGRVFCSVMCALKSNGSETF